MPTTHADDVRAYIATIAKGQLDAGEPLNVTYAEGPRGEALFYLECADSVKGYLLGRGGKTIDAIRRLARGMARAVGWDAKLDVKIDGR